MDFKHTNHGIFAALLKLSYHLAKKFTHLKTKGSGFTVFELLASTAISLTVTAGAMSLYGAVTSSYHDLGIRENIHDNSVSVMTLIGSELRMIGNGIPFDQGNFQILDTLHDELGNDVLSSSVVYPILIDTADNTFIQYRLNETGNVYFLVASFTPSPTTLTIYLNSVAGLYEGDDIYLSNSLKNMDDGMSAKIASIDTSNNAITIESEFIRSPGANFPVGCSLEPVATVTLSNTSDGIVRNSGFGDVMLARHASFTINYLNKSGTELTPPISEEELRDEIGSLRLTVSLTSAKRQKYISSGFTTFNLTRSQIYGLRSFNFTG